jgi:hypothetical protein
MITIIFLISIFASSKSGSSAVCKLNIHIQKLFERNSNNVCTKTCRGGWKQTLFHFITLSHKQMFSIDIYVIKENYHFLYIYIYCFIWPTLPYIIFRV